MVQSAQAPHQPGSEPPRRVRQAGLLLHPTSLPGGHGIGDLGGEATRLLDWMARAHVSLWQVLPLGPVGADGSPYSSWSAYAGNPLLVDLHGLVADGLLDASDLPARSPAPSSRVDFAACIAQKLPLVSRAAERLLAATDHALQPALAAFRAGNPWVEDVALFATVRRQQPVDPRTGSPAPWWSWPAPVRDRDPTALAALRAASRRDIDRHVAVEFLVERQWQALRERAHARGIQIFGDMPIYVGGDSADVWAGRGRFQLDPSGAPTAVAGVPPDAFSADGQLWGNPLYDWDAHANEGFSWWIARMRRAFAQCDVVRVDHFRAFAAYWSVAADAESARGGRWRPGPGATLFSAVTDALGAVDIVAEDLGTIDADVRRLMATAGLPGMEVLQFAFDGDRHNGYLPHHHRRASVVYVGTHDNDTALGWWRAAGEDVRHRVRTYLGVDGHDIVWDLIRLALSSVASRAVVTAQDVLALDGAARMNVPGLARGNWGWRLGERQLQDHHADRLRSLVETYGRGPDRGQT